MKTARRILAFVLSTLLVFSAAAALAAERFSQQDLMVNAVTASMNKDQVKTLCGDPASIEKVEQAATGDTQEIWHYPEFSLTFSHDGSIVGAYWVNAAVTGPRGLKVGDTAQKVVNAFYVDPATGTSTVQYSAGYVEALNAQLPPCGVTVNNNDGTFAIWYLDPIEPYGADVLANPAEYVFQKHASLLFTFDGSAVVTAIGWTIGTLAE